MKSGGGEFRTRLRKVAHSESLNVYAAVHDLLYPEAEPISEPEDATVSESLTMSLMLAKRLVIWGGQYSTEAKRKIMDAAPTLKVEIYDIFNRRSDVSGISKWDVLVCVTTSMNHSLYNVLRKHCRVHDIGFYHFDRPGQNPFIDFIHKLAT